MQMHSLLYPPLRPPPYLSSSLPKHRASKGKGKAVQEARVLAYRKTYLHSPQNLFHSPNRNWRKHLHQLNTLSAAKNRNSCHIYHLTYRRTCHICHTCHTCRTCRTCHSPCHHSLCRRSWNLEINTQVIPRRGQAKHFHENAFAVVSKSRATAVRIPWPTCIWVCVCVFARI